MQCRAGRGTHGRVAHQLLASDWSKVYSVPAASESLGLTPGQPVISYAPHSDAYAFHFILSKGAAGVHTVPVALTAADAPDIKLATPPMRQLERVRPIRFRRRR